MWFGSVARLVSAEGRRRATPLLVSGAFHAVLLVGLAIHQVSPVVLTQARPTSSGADTVTISVPVRFVGEVYGPPVGPMSSAPFRASADESARAKDAVAPGRSAGRRPRSKGISGLSGAAPAVVAEPSASVAPAPIAAPAPQEIEPVPAPSLDLRPPEPALAPVASEVVQMPVTVARGLRVFDTFPPLPQGLARAGRKYPVDLEICVDSHGTVADVHVERGAPDQLNAVVRSAVRTWRYRPYKINGTSRPFCHPLRIVYSTG